MMINITYYWYDYWQQNGHPYSMNYWISMNGPTRITIIIVGYLYFCLSLGPILMMNRKPFVLRKIMFIYNIMTIILNLYFFIQSLYYLDYGRRLFDFKFPDHTIITDVDVEQISLTHFYLWTKLLDLFDTIFFVLRKKNNQISGLHLYHHSIVPLLGWCAFCIAPTASCLGIFPLFNTAIHCIMYSYYALSSFGPKIQPYLWWKRYITQLQLAQFVIYGIYLIPFFKYQQGYPIKFWRFIAVPQPIIFFYLFYRFYRQSYMAKNERQRMMMMMMMNKMDGHQTKLSSPTTTTATTVTLSSNIDQLEIRKRTNFSLMNNDRNNNIDIPSSSSSSMKSSAITFVQQ
ncbi:hypothetical protein DERF_010611 [Dermatophagoides farinae]|uniref:Elongation of very long chain fatty acids protein n=1 Tax=Dermatophagoides farinae TaxID=6954 RepID=A0A922L3Z4_DERFA|nr:hypothetical protein DERF_010611 [Dermatophagoides farinae]